MTQKLYCKKKPFPEVKVTRRGFEIIQFVDHNGEECSLQKSSIIDEEECIWLGCDNNRKPHHVTGDELSPRMHLTQSQAKWIGKLLIKFSKTGRFSDE